MVQISNGKRRYVLYSEAKRILCIFIFALSTARFTHGIGQPNRIYCNCQYAGTDWEMPGVKEKRYTTKVIILLLYLPVVTQISQFLETLNVNELMQYPDVK